MRCCPTKRMAAVVALVLMGAAAMIAPGFLHSAEGAQRIGIVLPLSGRLAAIGEQTSAAFRFAADELRRKGVIRGDSLELIFADTAGDPATARAAVKMLISQEQVAALIGGISSPATREIAAEAQRRQVPFLITTASADDLTRQGWDYVFRLCRPASEQINTLADFLDGAVTGIRTAAVLHDESLLGPHRSEELFRTWEAREIETLLISGYPSFSRDFRPLLAKAKVKAPDFLFLIFSRQDAPMVLQQAMELRLRSKILFGEAAGFGNPELFQEFPDAAEHLCVMAQWASNAPYPGATFFTDEYRMLFDRTPDYRAAQAYAGMQVMLDAVRRARSTSSQAVRGALAKTTMGTIYGKVKFENYDSHTHQNRAPMLILQWLGGQYEIVWPGRLASKRLVFPNPDWRQR